MKEKIEMFLKEKEQAEKLVFIMNNVLMSLELIQEDSFLPLLYFLHHRKDKITLYLLFKNESKV